MPLTRKTKIWLIVLSIPVVLIIGSVIAVKMYFTDQRLKAFVVPKLEEATKRTVFIREIHLSVFPTLAVEIDSLSISNKQGFSERPFLALNKLVLDVRLATLLKGNLEITTVILERPQILLEVNKDGIANYKESQEVPARGDTGKITFSMKAEGGFLLSNLQIVDGTLAYIDRKGNSATTIEGWDQTLRVEIVAGTNEVRIEGQSTVGKFSYGSLGTPLISDLRLTSHQSLAYQIDKDVLTIQQGDATVEDIALTIKGTLAGLTSKPDINLVIESGKANITNLLSLAPKEYMKKAEGVKGTGDVQVKITLTGTFNDSTNPDVRGDISATNASIQYAQLPKSITNVSIVSGFTKTKARQEFHITKLSATLGNNPLSAALTMTNFDDPSIVMNVDASLNLADVREYYPLEAGTELAGAIKAKLDIAGKVSNPQAMKAAGSMEFRNVTIKTPATTKPIQNLNGTVTFNNQIIDAKKISMTLGKSDLTLGFSMKNYLSMMSKEEGAPKPTANLSLTSGHLYTADIMSEAPATKDAKQSAPAVTKKPQRSGVPLPNVDMDVAATVGTLTMEKFELSNVRGTMKISNGLIMLQNFSCNTFDGSIVSKGTLNLQKPEEPTFDLALDMNGVNGNSMLSKFSSFGQRLFGKLTMNTTLRGALDDTLGLIPNTLNGQGGVKVENGKLTGVEVNKAVAGFLNLPDLKEINFKDWANSFTIADGRLHIKDLKISALDADYVVNGSQGLDGSLDYSMALILPEKTSARIAVPGFAGQAVNLFKDESGRVKLDFSVGGTSDNPKIALDTKAAQKKVEDLAKQKLKEEGKKIEDQLKKKGEDLLKGLFKKK